MFSAMFFKSNDLSKMLALDLHYSQLRSNSNAGEYERKHPLPLKVLTNTRLRKCTFIKNVKCCNCLSLIMLNPLNTLCEYKPFTYISLLFKTQGTLCYIKLLL